MPHAVPQETAVLRAAMVLTPAGSVSPGEVRIERGRIVEVTATGGPVPDVVLAPGFVDLQVNGVEDVDIALASGDDWDRAAAHLAATGVTAWLPTLVSQPLERYADPLAEIAAVAGAPSPGSPTVLGAHLEGPFLGGRLGAHRPEYVVPVDLGWIDALPPVVRLVTLAPEQPEAGAAIDHLVARGVLVSLGHSDADLATVLAASDRGARMVTHLFNAMGPLHHREPGIVGAALTDDRLTAGLVADGIHVHPALFPLVFRAKPGRVVLVTDAIGWRARRVAGAGIEVVDGAPRLADGTIAGSVLTMDAAVRNVVDGGVALADAVAAAATAPATLVGAADRGRIEVDARADLVVLGRDDLAVRRTVVAGTVAWEA